MNRDELRDLDERNKRMREELDRRWADLDKDFAFIGRAAPASFGALLLALAGVWAWHELGPEWVLGGIAALAIGWLGSAALK